jgi:hypothetical protein
MASSVSSESTCSVAGIASKRCNRAEEDIFEAIQCLRSFSQEDLFFHDVVNATQEEETLDLADQEPANHEASSSDVVCDGEGRSWDELLESLEDEEYAH